MNEHPPHDGPASEPDPAELARIELASAYIDGDVDAVQRAEVEASSQLMAIVAALQQVRARVVNVPPVTATSRDLAITRALAEFDAMRAETATSTTAPSNVVPIGSRTRWTRVLSAAAAVVIVGVVGIVAVNGLHGTKSRSSGAAPAGGLSTSSGSTGTVGGSDKAAPEATIGSIGAPASARIEVDSPAQLLTVSDQYAITDVSTVNTVNTVNTANPTSAGVTDTGVSIASVSSTSTVPTATPGSKVPVDTTITTSSQNAGGGSAPSAPTPAAHQATERPAIPCPLNGHQVVLALISFKGVDAAAVRDTVTGEITALDMQCHVLATAHP
jgi:hypothetical protein